MGFTMAGFGIEYKGPPSDFELKKLRFGIKPPLLTSDFFS
jgi:hypothetical protein